MKRILLITSLFLMSCEKEEVEPINQTVENCDCDRIVDIKKFNMVGDAQTGESSYFWCHITTINDCNKIQKFKKFSYSMNYYTKEQLPNIGDCQNMGY